MAHKLPSFQTDCPCGRSLFWGRLPLYQFERRAESKDALQVVPALSPPSIEHQGKECPMTELWQMSGLALGRAIARREVSAVEVLDAIVARVEAVNQKVNAVVTLVAG